MVASTISATPGVTGNINTRALQPVDACRNLAPKPGGTRLLGANTMPNGWARSRARPVSVAGRRPPSVSLTRVRFRSNSEKTTDSTGGDRHWPDIIGAVPQPTRILRSPKTSPSSAEKAPPCVSEHCGFVHRNTLALSSVGFLTGIRQRSARIEHSLI